IQQIIQASGVIEQHRRRTAPKRRIKGHVFCSKRRSPKRGFERKELIRGICGFRRRRRGMWRRRTGRKFLYIQVQ
ncbi:hypothetical protein, partial [Klebsiella pneumoniae]|uniref:hypothetical protein n=1 Tax=Klebsiella pneumoniae TaxID=573 RepID=UPI001963AA9B